MARHEFGDPIEQDTLVLQGKEYTLQGYGMRAMRESLKRRQEIERASNLEGEERLAASYDLSMEIIVGSVIPEQRDAIRQHLEDTVHPSLVSQVATAIMRGFSDLDPTQPTSSSDGSSTTGPDSTDGVSLGAEPTPAT